MEMLCDVAVALKLGLSVDDVFVCVCMCVIGTMGLCSMCMGAALAWCRSVGGW
jgi:hypothetical protein